MTSDGFLSIAVMHLLTVRSLLSCIVVYEEKIVHLLLQEFVYSCFEDSNSNIISLG